MHQFRLQPGSALGIYSIYSNGDGTDAYVSTSTPFLLPKRLSEHNFDMDLNPTHDGKDLFTNHKEGTGNLFFRWYLLWTVPLILAPYPLWLSFVNCSLSYEISIILHAILLLNFTYAAALCWR